MLGALEALEAGTTAIIDHHSSPNAIEGSLDVIAEACAEVGVRVRVLLRGHRPPRRRRRQGRASPRTSASSAPAAAGLVGAHAALHAVATRRSTRCAGSPPTSASACTSTWPRTRSTRAAGARLADRADDDWLLAHGVHLDRDAAGHRRAQPALEPEQRGRLRPPGPLPTASRSAPTASAPTCSRSSASRSRSPRADDVTAVARHGVGVARRPARELVPEARDDRVTWSYDADGPVAPRLHARRAAASRSRSTARSCSTSTARPASTPPRSAPAPPSRRPACSARLEEL